MRRSVLVILFLCVLAVLTISLWLYSYASTPASDTPGESVVLIPRGASFEEITTLLDESDLVRKDIRLPILARGWGLAGNIRAGEFKLPKGRTPLETLRLLGKAKVVQHPVTVIEGLRAREIATLFAEKGWCEKGRFLELVKDVHFIEELGVGERTSLEGYLYPDTYHLTRIPEIGAKQIITMMVNRFFQIWKEIAEEDADMHETVILASIVEKETGAAEERARIASVFSNRLKRGMRLQSDPTVIYGMEDFDGDIRRSDLRRKNPYNTYVIKGLPAGPICSPGRAALAAALHPAEEDYLYFVSKNDGTHYFSRTLREHNRAVRKYQR